MILYNVPIGFGTLLFDEQEVRNNNKKIRQVSLVVWW